MGRLEDTCFGSSTLQALPVEPDEGRSHTPHQPALDLLGLDPSQAQRNEFVQVMAGNRLLPGMEPAAHCYCGYQFGNFAGQLGDGAAILLGEVHPGVGGAPWELQLKGSGLTPYSRTADGRKVLRSSIREFLASEALYHLGVPTTRAGSVVTSEDRVERDLLYTGHPVMERCSVVSRIAPSFLRFGSFEICKPVDPTTGRGGPSHGLETELLPRMLDHTIRSYFPDIWRAHLGSTLQATKDKEDVYLEFFREVVRRTAQLVAAWQCVGFCHGVLNTDNMSILGLTLDYGPYGFMDRFDRHHVCNHSDDAGRYDYAAQPGVCRWNCEKLAEALAPVLPASRSRAEVDVFDREFDRCYWATMRRKLGLLAVDEGAADHTLIEDLLQVMQDTGADFTNTFRRLAMVPLPAAGTQPSSSPAEQPGAAPASAGTPPENGAAGGSERLASGSFASSSGGGGGGGAEAIGDSVSAGEGDFLEATLAELAAPGELAAAAAPRMPAHNLRILAQVAAHDPLLLMAIGTTKEAVAADLQRLQRSEALAKLGKAEKAAADRAAWRAWLDRYSARLRREAAAGADAAARRVAMDAANPKFVLRNWVAQQAIEKAEAGDYSEVRRVLRLLEHPFDGDAAERLAADEAAAADGAAGATACVRLPKYDGPAPGPYKTLCVSCSS
ncbi:hypothetical protein WJX81_006471 [Elliptochloris bilobata]|uniref:Selenoprotein O n=1 Tax=Elliptochloris bilobata TaxID=381761 RepID=A0AAW1SAA8_9CHLO